MLHVAVIVTCSMWRWAADEVLRNSARANIAHKPRDRRRRPSTTNVKTAMVFHAASAVARRRVASMATQQMQRRSMGSGPKPEWTGIDKTVRDIFPEDWQCESIFNIPDSLSAAIY